LTAFRLSTSEIDGTIVVRYDSEQEFSPAPTFAASGSTGTVTIETGSESSPPDDTLITGAAKLVIKMPSNPKPTPVGDCTDNGKTTTQCSAVYAAFTPGTGSSAWTNGKPGLTAHVGVGGNFTLANTSGNGPAISGSITVASVGCKGP